MQLKDLREELRKRLQLVIAERGELEARIKFLQESEQDIKKLLQYEEMRVGHERSSITSYVLDGPVEQDRSKYALFIQDVLAAGKPRSLDDLKKAALDARIDFHGKNPGRVLHYVLLGMSQNNAVERVSKGIWVMRAATGS